MRIYSLDLLKIILAILVVAIHTHPLINVENKLYFFLDHGIARVAVPIFFIITGYFLSDSKEKIKRWLFTTCVIYLGLSVLYLPFFVNTESIINIIKSSIRGFLMGNAHLWFFPAMMEAGIIVFLLRGRIKLLLFLSVISFAMGCYLQYRSLYISSLSIASYRSVLFSLPFVIMGYLIRNVRPQEKLSRRILLLMLIISCLIFFAEIYLNYVIGYDAITPLNGHDIYLSLIILCPLIFLFFLRLKLTPQVNDKYSQYTYFFHMFFILMLESIGVDRGFVCFLLVIASCIITSEAIYLIKKAPSKLPT